MVQFFLGLKFFKPVKVLFSFVSDYDNENKTKKNKNQTGLKIFIPRNNLNHNIYIKDQQNIYVSLYCAQWCMW